MGLLDLFLTKTQGRPGQEVPVSTKCLGSETTQSAWEKEGQVGREPK